MQLSTTGWIILILFAIFILTLNISLFSSGRKKPKAGSWQDQLGKARDTISHPFKDEDDKFSELSSRVEELKKKKP
jgi:hypothetical protein